MSFSKYWCCGIGEQHSKYWNIYWVLMALRRTKSGIEYVILAGSSLLGVFEGKMCFLVSETVSGPRSARFFQEFRDLGTR